jgi:tetratricopeptide (TPR) repeat protein
MEMFADDDAVAQWELDLLPLRGAARLPLLMSLSWHLRQRDCARASELVEEASALLPHAGLEPAERDASAARLLLVQGEIDWLSSHLEAADELAHQAEAELHRVADHAGCADAHWLLAWVAVDRGDHARRDAELAAAAECARLAGDTEREAIADAASARWHVLRDLHSATARWGKRFDLAEEVSTAVDCWINDFLGMAASQASDFGNAAGFYIRSYEAALETGQIRSAITSATNIAEKFANLNDLHSALEWMQRAMELARPTSWPRSIGSVLMHTADFVRRLGRLDAAQEMLHEALGILAPVANARSYAIALQFLGDLCLSKDDYAGALDSFQRLAVRADALQQADFTSVARRGQAHALCYLDRPQEALEMAQQAV